jgi:hypothetical protein
MTACTRIPHAQLAADSYAACSLVAVRGIHIAHAQFQQAVRDFEHQQGYPYSLLYVETHAGSSASSTICIRLVQQAENQFTYYTYHDQQVSKSAVTNPSWGQSLAAVGQGHFTGLCTNYATEPAEGILLVKHDRTILFSLDISLHERRRFAGADKARVERALQLVGRVLRYNTTPSK